MATRPLQKRPRVLIVGLPAMPAPGSMTMRAAGKVAMINSTVAFILVAMTVAKAIARIPEAIKEKIAV